MAEKETVPEQSLHGEGDIEAPPALPNGTPALSSRPATQEGERIEQNHQTATGEKTGSENENGAKTVKEEVKNNNLTGPALYILVLGLCLAVFTVALDNTVIATAIPRITNDFGSLNNVGWYGSSYLLTTTSLQPSFGKIYGYFNVKWCFIAALLVFEIGSIVGAVSQNSTTLIVGRAIAGAGAAGIFSGSLNIIGYTVPLSKRSAYIGSISSMYGIASIVGPILGGVFTDRVTWRWCFWVNLPFGGTAMLVVFAFFKNPGRKSSTLTIQQKIKQMDLLGALFLISAVICLLLALQFGGSVYPWNDSRVWGCLLGFALLGTSFIAVQFWRGEFATIPPRVIKQRSVAAACFFGFFLAMGHYIHVYYLPIYFQAVLGTSAEESGIRIIPYLVSWTLAAVVSGIGISKFGFYVPWMWGGSVIYIIAAGLLHTLQVNSTAGKWVGYALMAGIGDGACIQVPFTAVQAVLSPKDMPIGNALAAFFNTIGGAISISVAQNIFSNTLREQLLDDPALSAGQVTDIINAGATGARSASPPSQLPAVLQAYDLGIRNAFIAPIVVIGIAFLLSLCMEWRSVKGPAKKKEQATEPTEAVEKQGT